jgi:hypothetical protein
MEKCVSADTVTEPAQSVSIDTLVVTGQSYVYGQSSNLARSVSADTPAKPIQGACL